MSFKNLSAKSFNTELWIVPVDEPVVQALSAPVPESTLGLPLLETNKPEKPVSCAPATNDGAAAGGVCAPTGSTVPVTGHFRVVGVNGYLLSCDENIVVYITGPVTRIEPVCDQDPTYSALVPIGTPIRFVELKYGPSLLESSRGCSADGGGSANISYDPGTRTVTLSAEVHAKIKCFGKTIFDDSESLSFSKRLDDLTPCVDFRQTAGPFFLSGKLCLRGGQICAEDLSVGVSVGGNDFGLDGIPNVCVGFANLAPSPCGCGSK